MDQKIRVLLIEDETIVSDAICALLARELGIAVIGEADTAEAGIRKARLLKPDVILLDLRLPDRPGIGVIEEIMEINPAARILVLTAHADDEAVAAAFRAGVVGYVLKTQAITDLVQAIECAYQGRSSLHPTIARMMLHQFQHPPAELALEKVLTKAELRVLASVGQGFSDKEIARTLGTSRITVSAHMSHILRKLRLSSRTQAALYAVRQGLVKLDALPKQAKSIE